MDEHARRSRRSRWALRGLVVAALLVVIAGAVSSVSSTGLQAEILGTIGVLRVHGRRRGHPRPAAGRAGRPDLSRCRPDLWRGHDPAPGVEFHGPPARPDHADRSRPRGHRIHRRVACIAAERPAAHQPLSRSSARSMAASCRGPAHGAPQPGRHRRAAKPGLLDISLLDIVENPLGLDWMPSDPNALFAVTVLTYAAASLVATFGLVRRYRAGGPVAGPRSAGSRRRSRSASAFSS